MKMPSLAKITTNKACLTLEADGGLGDAERHQGGEVVAQFLTQSGCGFRGEKQVVPSLAHNPAGLSQKVTMT